jgi:hypothetical protein
VRELVGDLVGSAGAGTVQSTRGSSSVTSSQRARGIVA